MSTMRKLEELRVYKKEEKEFLKNSILEDLLGRRELADYVIKSRISKNQKLMKYIRKNKSKKALKLILEDDILCDWMITKMVVEELIEERG